MNDNSPPIEHFYSKLSERHVTEAEYAHAQDVWRTFGCETIRNYLSLYLSTDVLQLADIFENWRDKCLQPDTYQLDPAHYVSAPQLTWDAMLKHTKVELDLVSDPAIFEMIDSGLRGGVSVISQRHAQANNKYMSTYDSSKPSSYIIYWDKTNLYGEAMSMSLPSGGFEWVPEEEFSQINWFEQTDEQETGYILEVDLEYPAEIHEIGRAHV